MEEPPLLFPESYSWGQAKGGLLGVGLETIKPFEQVLTGNEVIVFGYPTSLGLAQFPQIDTHRPLLRKGIVGRNKLEQMGPLSSIALPISGIAAVRSWSSTGRRFRPISALSGWCASMCRSPN